MVQNTRGHHQHIQKHNEVYGHTEQYSWRVERLFPEHHEAEFYVDPATTEHIEVCSTMRSIFTVSAGLPEKQTNKQTSQTCLMIHGFRIPLASKKPRGSHPGPREPFLPGPQLGWSFSEACHPQCSNHNLSGAVGVGLKERRAIVVSRCASKRASSLGPPGGWLADCGPIKYCDWLHSRHLPLTCRHNLFCRLSLAKCYLPGFPVPLRILLGIFFPHLSGNEYTKKQTSFKCNWENKSTANNVVIQKQCKRFSDYLCCCTLLWA